MEFDFVISVHSFKNSFQYFCNLNKGDLIMDTDTEAVYSSNILYKFSTNLKEIL